LLAVGVLMNVHDPFLHQNLYFFDMYNFNINIFEM